MAATLPLLFFRPAAAALTIAAANTAVLAVAAANTTVLGWFGTATVAGIAAQLIAGFRLGRQGDPRGPDARGSAAAQVVALALAVPFVVLVLTSHGSVAAVLLAWGTPTAAAAGIAVRARRETRTGPRRARHWPTPSSSTPPAASAPGSPASCTTWSPITFPWSRCRRRPPG